MKWLTSFLIFLLLTFGAYKLSRCQVLLYPDRSSYWTGAGGGCVSPTSLEVSTDSTAGLNSDAANDTLWQSFQNSNAFTVVGCSVKVAYTSGGDAGDSLQCTLWTDNTDDPGTILRTKALIWSDLPNTLADSVYFEFDTEASGLSANTTYWIGLHTNNTLFNWKWITANTNPYANGHVRYSNDGGARANLNSNDNAYVVRGCE